MYTYLVCSETNELLFHRQCAALEKHIPGLKNERLLEDVDGTLIQAYRKKGSKLVVFNNYETGDIYIDSEFDLQPYFPRAKKSPFADEEELKK